MPRQSPRIALLVIMVISTVAGAQERPEPAMAELAPGDVRVLESYPKETRRDGWLDFDYLVLDETRPLSFAAGGPSSVVFVVRSFESGEVAFRLQLGERTDTIKLNLSPAWSRTVLCRVPVGTHVITLAPEGRVLVRVVPGKRRTSPPRRTIGPETSPAGEPEADPSLLDDWEDEPADMGFWVMLGVGGGAQLDPVLGGWSWGANLNLRIRHYLVQLRYTHALEMEDQESGPLPSESTWEVGGLFGMGLRGRWGWLAGGAGLALVGGTRRGDFLQKDEDSGREVYESDDFLGIGFPLSVQIFATPYSCLGLGVEVFANLNFDRPFFGALLAVQLGEI